MTQQITLDRTLVNLTKFMSDNLQSYAFTTAVSDFQQARRRASLEKILSQFTGKSTNLLSFDEVRQKLKVSGMADKGLQEIPLSAIIGSVNRYTDFTRTFLPRRDEDENRWARVQVATTGLAGVPPILVYQINQSYFVIDGNHRVSVSRELGATMIQAYVTEVRTKVPLANDDQLDDLLRKSEYADFLERTELNESRPELNLLLTVPGKYWMLEAQIEAHYYLLQKTHPEPLTYRQVAMIWADEIYLPVVQSIRERGILHDFPRRTEADLYVWLIEHQATLKQNLGWRVTIDEAMADLQKQFGTRLPNVIERFSHRVLEVIALDTVAAVTKDKEELLARSEHHLFGEVLVAMTSFPKSLHVLEQAIEIVQREQGQVRGLHVVTTEAAKTSETVKALRAEFEYYCKEALVKGELALEVGAPTPKIVERARWADLLVVPLNHPPKGQILARLGSGFHTLIAQSPRPILAVPYAPSRFQGAVLAYDGSAKAKEALFVGAYMSSKWSMRLVVVSVGEMDLPYIDEAQEYLANYNIKATYVRSNNSVATAILEAAQVHACDLVILGGYGYNAMMAAVMGSTVDEVLRRSSYPVFICR